MAAAREIRPGALWVIAAALGAGLLLAPLAGLAGYGTTSGDARATRVPSSQPVRSAAADILAPHFGIAGLELLHRGNAARVIEQHDLYAVGA